MIPDLESSGNDSPADRIALWLDLMCATDKLLLAGLRRRIGPDGDLQEAYQQWYAEQRREHDEAVERIVKRLAVAAKEISHAR